MIEGERKFLLKWSSCFFAMTVLWASEKYFIDFMYCFSYICMLPGVWPCWCHRSFAQLSNSWLAPLHVPKQLLPSPTSVLQMLLLQLGQLTINGTLHGVKR